MIEHFINRLYVPNTYAKNILQILMNFGKKVKLEVVVLKVLVHRQPTLHQ